MYGFSRPVSLRDRLDRGSWPQHHVAAREDAFNGRLKRRLVHLERATRRDAHKAVVAQEREIRTLPDGGDERVRLNNRL